MISFALAVLLLTITPGPAVLTLAGVGSAFGWRQGLLFLSGLFIGVHLVCFAVISGLAALVMADPVVRTVLLLASSAYLGYLALRIALAGTKIGFIHMAAPGFVTGVTLQLINPKAYAVNTMLFSSFAFYPESFAIETTLKLIINNSMWIPIHVLWLYAGVKVSQLNLPTHTHRLINLIMAGCLLAVVGLSVWSIY
jgi:threonine/homoserine/homoserine lactone efflux protein